MMDKEREILMLINYLRKSAESLKESVTWTRNLSYNEQCEKVSYFTLNATATVEAALAEAYKLVSIIINDKACERMRELYKEDNNDDTEICAQTGGNCRS